MTEKGPAVKRSTIYTHTYLFIIYPFKPHSPVNKSSPLFPPGACIPHICRGAAPPQTQAAFAPGQSLHRWLRRGRGCRHRRGRRRSGRHRRHLRGPLSRDHRGGWFVMDTKWEAEVGDEIECLTRPPLMYVEMTYQWVPWSIFFLWPQLPTAASQSHICASSALRHREASRSGGRLVRIKKKGLDGLFRAGSIQGRINRGRRQ